MDGADVGVSSGGKFVCSEVGDRGFGFLFCRNLVFVWFFYRGCLGIGFSMRIKCCLCIREKE